MRDKRHHPRLDCSLSVFLIDIDANVEPATIDTIIEAHAADLSEQGLRVECSVNLQPGSFICALVFFKGTKSLCFGQVRWKKRKGKYYAYGLFFKEWSALTSNLAMLLTNSSHTQPFFKLRSILSKLAA